MSLTEAQKRRIEEEEQYRQVLATSSTHAQKHGVPLVLSFFIPGLGQIVKGQFKKGLIILFAPAIGIIMLVFSSFVSSGSSVLALFGQFWIAWIAIYIWQLIDAYNN